MHEINACRSEEFPYDALQKFLLGQFGKSKWTSYFDLLRLPSTVETARPSTVLARLGSYLPFNADANNEIFMAMFLMRLPPSIRESVGSSNHTITVVTPCGVPVAAPTRWSPPPRLSVVGAPPTRTSERTTYRAEPSQKAVLPHPSVFKTSKTPLTVRASFTIIMV